MKWVYNVQYIRTGRHTHTGCSESWHDRQWALNISTTFPILRVFFSLNLNLFAAKNNHTLWFFMQNTMNSLHQNPEKRETRTIDVRLFRGNWNLDKCQSTHFESSIIIVFGYFIYSQPTRYVNKDLTIQTSGVQLELSLTVHVLFVLCNWVDQKSHSCNHAQATMCAQIPDISARNLKMKTISWKCFIRLRYVDHFMCNVACVWCHYGGNGGDGGNGLHSKYSIYYFTHFNHSFSIRTPTEKNGK